VTYILGTSQPSRSHYYRDTSGYDIVADKLIYLGSKGLFTTRQGLTIVYLSGLEDIKDQNPKSDGDTAESTKFTLSDVENLDNIFEKRKKSSTNCVDILITNQWPKYIEKSSGVKLDDGNNSMKFGSELIAYLAVKLQPRYHFSGLQNIFFERLPYRNHEMLVDKATNLTRFLGLAKVNKSNKPKYLYAFNLTPASKMTNKELAQSNAPKSTDSPYKQNIIINKEDMKRKALDSDEDEEESEGGFFYDAGHIKKMNAINERAMTIKKKKLEEREMKKDEPCWFCLGGTKVERHYIVSVGDKCYLAYAKGALNQDNLLIIPIDHVQSTVHADEALLEEINKYKWALQKYFKSKNGCVLFYERNFRTKHMQIQVFALRADKSYLLKDAFMSSAKTQNVHLNEIPQFTNLKQVIEKKHPFYYLELPSDEESEEKFICDRYLAEIRGGGFPLNFGRNVVASEILLNLPEREDWRECALPLEDEKKMSIEFRNAFKPFDPSS